MSRCLVKLNSKRICRYVFEANLWEDSLKKFGDAVDILLDTGSFNTIIHADLVSKYGKRLGMTMRTSVGGYVGDTEICVLHKLRIGKRVVIEKVVALAIPFAGELKDHILLGANVTNNWKFAVSRLDNNLEFEEQFSEVALKRRYPYGYCFDNKGRIMAFSELES